MNTPHWSFFSPSELKPQGWMRRQLEIQAEGLSGNLDLMWRDIRDSAWIGGSAEGWERVPYWLDGFIPLAYLLENEDMITRVHKYIDAILAHQCPDGWICPCKDEERATYDTWSLLLITKVLTVYYECSGDERIPAVLHRTLKNFYDLLSAGTLKLFSWGKARWFEGFIAIAFLYKRNPEEWLRDLARLLKAQGTDYPSHVEKWKVPINEWTFETHIVNAAMMLKYEAVSCDLLGEDYTDVAESLHHILETYNGTPVGLFTGDECFSGLSPIQGTELCSVVEQMYSFELLYAYTGDPKWAERLEKITFNGLPATLDDRMLAHQYVQQSNQIECTPFPGRSIFRTNGSEAHVFGLEPNFGCCTANFNQGWPKFALSAFLHNANRVISAIPVPSELTTPLYHIRLETNYPFEADFTYTVETTTEPLEFVIRIPTFARNAKVDGAEATAGDFSVFFAPGESRTLHVHYDITPTFRARPNALTSLEYGPLVFSVPIAYHSTPREYTRDGVERKAPFCDYDITPTSDWKYAFTGSAPSLKPTFHGIGEIPFSSTRPPLTLQATLQPIAWELEDGFRSVCAKLPVQPITPTGSPQSIALYPYGCTMLRMTEIPLLPVE